MSDSWIILELSHLGEKEEPQRIKRIIQRELDDSVEVFIPALSYTRKENTVTICYTQGYVFVRAGLTPCRYHDLEESPYIERVMTHDEDGRYLCYLPDTEVQRIKETLREMVDKEIAVGDTVLVRDGAYSQLEGEVVVLYPEENTAEIHILGLRSLDTVVKLPIPFLEKK